VAHVALKLKKPAPPRGRLAELGIGAAWLVGLGAALQIADAALGRSPVPAAVAGAVIADVVAGFAGVRWTTEADGRPSKGETDTVLALKRAGFGAGAAAAAVTVTLVAAAIFGWIRVEAGSPSASLALALIRSTALGVRDEIFLRGIVLVTAARAGVHPLVAAGFAALAGGAAIALTPEAGPSSIALAVGSGLLFAALWQKQRGAWAAVGAHAIWIFFVSAGLRGGLLDVTWTQGSLAAGARSYGGPAWLSAFVCAALGIGILFWKKAEAPSPPPPEQKAPEPPSPTA
jgi:hypothetical protein